MSVATFESLKASHDATVKAAEAKGRADAFNEVIQECARRGKSNGGEYERAAVELATWALQRMLAI